MLVDVLRDDLKFSVLTTATEEAIVMDKPVRVWHPINQVVMHTVRSATELPVGNKVRRYWCSRCCS